MNTRRLLLLLFLIVIAVGCIPTDGGSGLEPSATFTAIPSNTPTIETIPPAFTSTSTATATSTGTAAPTPTATATTVPCQRPLSWVEYVIQPGDTLSSLAQNTGSTINEIKTVNCLAGDLIYAGQEIFLPRDPGASPSPTATNFSPPTATPTVLITSPFSPTPTPTASRTPTATSTSELPPPPGPGDPVLTIIPSQGVPGTTFTFIIEDFVSYEEVSFEIRDPTYIPIYQVNIILDEDGYGEIVFQIPTTAPGGTYAARASGQYSSASEDFTVISIPTTTPTLTPTTMPTPTYTTTPASTPTQMPGYLDK